MWNKTIGHVVFLILAKDSTEETHICEKEEVVISLKRRKEMGKWERNISIQELIWKVVLSWRTIILSAVIVAVAATSLRYVIDMREYKVSVAENNLAGASSQFSEEELGQIEEARLLQKRMAEMRTYMDESVLMQVDPYKENVLTLEYYVDYLGTESLETGIDNAVYIAKAYQTCLTDGRFARTIFEDSEIECKAEYVEELIHVEVDEDAPIVSIEVIYPDASILKSVSDIAKEVMEGKVEELTQKMPNHTVSLLTESVGMRTDEMLIERQSDYQEILYHYRTWLNSTKSTMSAEQLVELYKDDSAQTITGDATRNIPKPTISKTYMILGLAVGAFFAVVFLVLRVLLEGRLQFETEMADGYGVRIFGVFEPDRKKNVIDRFLIRLKNRSKKSLSPEENMKALCTNIELTCKNQKIERIFLTGTALEQIDTTYMEEMKKYMGTAGIEVVSGNNVCYDVEALRQMSDVKRVVLIEKVGTSIYREIEQEINYIKEQDGNILGCVVIK